MAEIKKADHARQWRILISLLFAIVYQIALGFIVTLAFLSIQDQRDADCEAAKQIRDESNASDLHNFDLLGQELGAPQERIDQFLEKIKRDQKELPPPPTCQ